MKTLESILDQTVKSTDRDIKISLFLKEFLAENSKALNSCDVDLRVINHKLTLVVSSLLQGWPVVLQLDEIYMPKTDLNIEHVYFPNGITIHTNNCEWLFPSTIVVSEVFQVYGELKGKFNVISEKCNGITISCVNHRQYKLNIAGDPVSHFELVYKSGDMPNLSNIKCSCNVDRVDIKPIPWSAAPIQIRNVLTAVFAKFVDVDKFLNKRTRKTSIYPNADPAKILKISFANKIKDCIILGSSCTIMQPDQIWFKNKNSNNEQFQAFSYIGDIKNWEIFTVR